MSDELVGRVSAGLAALAAAADCYVADVEPVQLSTPDLLAEIVARERLRRSLQAADHALIVELERRGASNQFGSRSTAALLVDTLRLSPGAAAERVRAAHSLGPRSALTGAPMPPLLPTTAAAHAAGVLSRDHVGAILHAISALPSNLPTAEVAAAEEILTDVARYCPPKQVQQAGQRLLDTLDPDGDEPTDTTQAPRRFALRQGRDGWYTPTGRLSPGCGATAEAVLNAHAAPRPSTDPESGSAVRDDRTAGQRTHDALLDILNLALRADTLPITGRRAHLIVTATEQDPSPCDCTQPAQAQTGKEAGADWAAVADADVGQPDSRGTGCHGTQPHRTGSGRTEKHHREPSLARSAHTTYGARLSRASAQALCDTALRSRALLSRAGAVLDYARTRRFATKAQLSALTARDGGCSFPGCDHPPEWCDAHHIIAWTDNGPTSLINLTLVCGYHHRNFQRAGWQCRITNGYPEWLPPRHIDVDRRPRRNSRYLIRELQFLT